MDTTAVAIIKQQANKKDLPTRSIYTTDWLSWYRGNVKDYHNYRLYNGTEYIDIQMLSMQMAKFVCETWANLLMNERCDIIIPKAQKETLDDILNETNFWVKANEGIEKAFALGFGALVMNIKGVQLGNKGTIKKDNAKISIDFVNALKIYPITIEDKDITECAFVSSGSENTNIVIHQKNELGNYVINNVQINKEGKITKSYTFDTKSPLQWFFIIRPNIANNLITDLTDDEIGVSVYANSIDTLKAIDSKYDGFHTEYILGRKRMFVSADAYRVDIVDNKKVKTFDPRDSLFYNLGETQDGKPFIENKTDELRYEAYVKGLNTELNYLSMKCGMGETFLKFDGSNVQTATQVISENSTLYRTIKKHEIILENVLRNLTKAIIYASNTFTSKPIGDVSDKEIKIKFDDSIIEDKGAEMERDKADVNSNIMSKIEYRMKWYGEDETTAIKNVEKYFLYESIDNYTTALATGSITPEIYVDKVFPNRQDKESIIEYIKNFMSRQEVDIYSGDETGGEEDGVQEEIEEETEEIE